MRDRMQIDGRWYIAEDALPRPTAPAPEPWEPLKALCREYGVDPHAAYAAIRSGELDARIPNGLTRGYRCRRSEFVRWMESRMARR